MTRAPPSAVAAIGGFGIGVAMLSVAATAAIVLIAPEPAERRVSIAQAAAALTGDARGFERSVGAEPAGRRAFVFETVLADQLRRPIGDVRLVFTGPTSPVGNLTARLRRGAEPMPVMVMQRRSEGRPGVATRVTERHTVYRSDDVRLLSRDQMPPPMVRLGLSNVSLNAFAASVRQADGRWLTVRPYEPWLSGWRLRVLAAILVSLALIVPLAWLFARRLTRPFRALARAVDDGDTAIPVAGPRELREAAAAIGAMRARLAEEGAERLRMLVAIAHDLRTPLTGLRLRIEGVAEPGRSRMVADVERMGAMIGEVLEFARGTEAPRTVFALGPLAIGIARDMDAGRGIVHGAAEGDVPVEASEPAIRRAIENLLRNAIDHAGGGQVAVTRDGAMALVAVGDAGPGIPPADRARLLRPFQRGDASRNRDTGGAGLGLGIVQDIAERHGGTLTLGTSAAGGLLAELRLPLGDVTPRGESC